jgi:hypothetical protein
MIICPDCVVDIHILGKNCLELVIDCISLEKEGLKLALDTTHMKWKLRRNGTLKPIYELESALGLLERNGYVISTEIDERLLGVCLNRKDAEICDNDIICWCARSGL